MMLAESLRYLLSIHNGKVPVDQLSQLFQQAFKHLPVIMEDAKIQEWISNNNILSMASQVVHLNNNKWLVWAPGAYQYPTRTVSARPTYSHPPPLRVVSTDKVVTSSPAITNDDTHILHGNQSISSSSNTDVVRQTVSSSPLHGKRLPGSMKKNIAIKFPSASVTKAKDIPVLLNESSNEM